MSNLTEHKFFIEALHQLVSGRFSLQNREVEFHDGDKLPDDEVIQAKIDEIQADYDAKQYQRDRASAYPSWQDQMDLLYHGGINALKAELKKTKDKFPKP